MGTQFSFKFLRYLHVIFVFLALLGPAYCQKGQLEVVSSADLKLQISTVQNIPQEQQAAIFAIDELWALLRSNPTQLLSLGAIYLTTTLTNPPVQGAATKPNADGKLDEERNQQPVTASASQKYSALRKASETLIIPQAEIQQQIKPLPISSFSASGNQFGVAASSLHRPRENNDHEQDSRAHESTARNGTARLLAAIDLTNIVSGLGIPTAAPSPQIVSTEFSGIGLYHDVPINFTAGENFRFHGLVTNPTAFFTSTLVSITTYNQVTVMFSSPQINSQIRCVQVLAQGQYEFDINCFMGNATGTFYMSVFAGRTGMSSSKLRNILSDTGNLPKTGVAPLPINLSLGVVNNQLLVSWSSLAPISKLVFSQNLSNRTLSVQYLLSNSHTSFSVPFVDFKNFKAQQTWVELSHASATGASYYTINSDFSLPSTLSFQAMEHKFSTQTDLSKISPPIPWRMAVGQKFIVQGSISSAISSDVFLVSPTLAITKIRIGNNSFILAGVPIKFDISFNVSGAHLLEINAVTGEAVINRPIYVGDGYPLLPDFQDVQTGTSQTLSQDLKALEQLLSVETGQSITEPPATADLQSKRGYLLSLTNILRQKYSQSPLYLDNALNAIAQAHSDEMRSFGYFSHADLLGQDPGQRAKSMGFLSTIGENIAMAYTLTEVHLQLERSASHLENSVNPIWTRVGIGISQALNGQIYVTYDFSSRDLFKQPLTLAEIQAYQQQLVAIARKANPSLQSEDKALSQIVGDWMKTDRSTALFAYVSSKGAVRRSMAASIIQVTYRADWLSTVRSDTSFMSKFTGYTQVSVGVALVNLELIEAYLLYS